MTEDTRWKQRFSNCLQAFKDALMQDGEAWMDMIKARDLTSHTYNTAIASGIAANILD